MTLDTVTLSTHQRMIPTSFGYKAAPSLHLQPVSTAFSQA